MQKTRPFTVPTATSHTALGSQKTEIRALFAWKTSSAEIGSQTNPTVRYATDRLQSAINKKASKDDGDDDTHKHLTKPKHHFLDHLVVDIYRYGPARGYWCMAFEAFNAIVKRAANKSNFKCELVSLMIHWSMKSAIALSGQRCQLSAEEDS